MLHSLKINNFRCFKSFELNELGRVNLLVGKNNSGKTSVLEAIHLLMSPNHLQSLREMMVNRGEFLLNPEPAKNRAIDVKHLFYEHQFNRDSSFSIIRNTDEHEDRITISFELHPHGSSGIPEVTSLESPNSQEGVKLIVSWKGKGDRFITHQLPYQNSLDLSQLVNAEWGTIGSTTDFNMEFVRAFTFTSQQMIDLFDQVVLTPEEDLVIEALKLIEPTIERIAIINFEKYRHNPIPVFATIPTGTSVLQSRYEGSRDGFVVRLSNQHERIPIGNMGDGIWRMLGLVLAMVNARGGFYLWMKLIQVYISLRWQICGS